MFQTCNPDSKESETLIETKTGATKLKIPLIGYFYLLLCHVFKKTSTLVLAFYHFTLKTQIALFQAFTFLFLPILASYVGHMSTK